MVYEIISPRPHGSETFVGLHTEYPECIDPLSVQEAMLSGGNKIIFKGTEKEYEAVKKKLSQMGIRLLSEDCGLNYGRTVEFYTENGDYVIKSVGKPRKVI